MDHIKRLATSKVAPVNSDSDKSVKVTRKKKASTGVLPACNNKVKNTPKYHVAYRHCVMYKKSGMYDCKWKSHTSKTFFGKSSDRAYVKDGLVGTMVNRSNAVNHCQKNEKKCKRELISLKK